MPISRSRADHRRSETPSSASSSGADAPEEGSTATTVLVVDDNEDNIRIVSAMLLSRGFEVRIARDGKGALESVKQLPPDVILLDVMMPGMDGIEVLDHIKADPRSASIPVIMVTAKSQDEDLLVGYKYGAEYYVTKPFTARQILYAIGLVLGTEEPE
jgi:CheY-like chemotaxis protein